MAKGKFFQLCLYRCHAQAFGQWHIDLGSFTHLILLLCGRHCLQSTHIMQAIGEFKDNNAWIFSHSEQHLTHSLATLATLIHYREGWSSAYLLTTGNLFGGPWRFPGQDIKFRHAINDSSHFLPKLFL